MTLMIELLAEVHEGDLRREAQQQRLRDIAAGCRRLLLGVLPIGQRCEAACS